MGRDPPDSKSNQPRPRDGSTSAGVRSAQLWTCGAGTTAGSGVGGAGLRCRDGHPGRRIGAAGGNPTSGSARAIISRSVDFAVVRDVT